MSFGVFCALNLGLRHRDFGVWRPVLRESLRWAVPSDVRKGGVPTVLR